MAILVINCGSTSIKLAALNPVSGTRFCEALVQRLGGDPEKHQSTITWSDQDDPEPCPTVHGEVLEQVLQQLLEKMPSSETIIGVGHRVAHGGKDFGGPTRITDQVVATIQQLVKLAPLHNPANLAGIHAARQLLPDLPHVAVFDTAFHRTLPRRARNYALPNQLAEKNDIQRFGFHGTSHQFVAHRAAAFLGENLSHLRVVTCHLGGGCSLCAVEYGRSVETSMGMTPLEGLVMATRAGDIDAGVLLHLIRSEDLTVDALDHLLNRESGLAGLSGIGSDLRDIESAAEGGDDNCRMAIQVFCHRVRKYLGAYAAVMGGVDAIVFTGGIGENSATVRHRVAQRLGFLGARLDESRNREARLSVATPVAEISERHSRVRLLAVATDESLAIAQQTHDLCQSLDGPGEQQVIPVAVSARHVHLTQATVERLFGDGYQLTQLKPLSQPGQFACNEVVTLVGPKRQLESVRILGPTREKDQVEISRTDEFHLGIDAPVRASGNVENSPGITLLGTQGRKVELRQGTICAWRHIHMTPEDAKHFCVVSGDRVEVEVGRKTGRLLTFGDVLIRVKPSYRLEMHIDTDEANAAELKSLDVGELTATEGQATLQKKCR